MRFPKMTGEARPRLPHMTSRHWKSSGQCTFLFITFDSNEIETWGFKMFPLSRRIK